MPNSFWIYSVRRRHVSAQTYKPGTGAFNLSFNSNSIKTVIPQRLVNHVAVAPAEQRHSITPRVLNNYSSGSINALAVEHKQSQQCTPWHKCRSNWTSGMLQERRQACNWLVHTIGTLFINGYYGCRRAWAGQLTLCMGRKTEKGPIKHKKTTSVASWEGLQAKCGIPHYIFFISCKH